jgi:hypothetical protein
MTISVGLATTFSLLTSHSSWTGTDNNRSAISAEPFAVCANQPSDWLSEVTN